MSPRTGRPKVENAKTEKMSISLDGQTKRTLEEYSDKHSITKSETIRRGINLLASKDK